jgi:hypothetical protein
MTKGELLKFLEPFTDELELVIDTGEDKLSPLGTARYHMLPSGEGIVRLCATHDLTEWLAAPAAKTGEGR